MTDLDTPERLGHAHGYVPLEGLSLVSENVDRTSVVRREGEVLWHVCVKVELQL